MHKWNANIVTASGRSFKGRAKLVSEHLVSVRVHDVVAQHTECQIAIALPEQPGGDAVRQVNVLCSVLQVVFGGNGIRLEMTVESILSEDRQIFLAHCTKTNKQKPVVQSNEAL
jgi:hypothetical protein